MWSSSIPANNVYARRNELNPSIGRIRRLMFDISMILLNQIVQVFTLPHRNRFLSGFVGVEYGHRRSIRAAFINGHDFWFAVVANRFAEKTQSCSCIPLSRE